MNWCLTPLKSARLRALRMPWVLMLVIALPAAAVIAGLATFGLSLRHADHELPTDYHWEGAAYDREQAMLEQAATEKLSATLHLTASGVCELRLRGAQPAALRLSLTHPTDPTLDRSVALTRDGDRYVSPCGSLPVAHWWISVTDEGPHWMLRARTYGALQVAVPLRALGGGS